MFADLNTWPCSSDEQYWIQSLELNQALLYVLVRLLSDEQPYEVSGSSQVENLFQPGEPFKFMTMTLQYI